jgi:hypothetical protein
LLVEVMFAPSRRKRFSLTPDPKTDTSVVPPEGVVGDTPGSSLSGSERPWRRSGIAAIISALVVVRTPVPRASRPAPSTTTESPNPEDRSTMRRSIVSPARRRIPVSRRDVNPVCSTSNSYTAGRQCGHVQAPLSSVGTVRTPPMSAGELIGTVAPTTARPGSSLTVPTMAPVRACA